MSWHLCLPSCPFIHSAFFCHPSQIWRTNASYMAEGFIGAKSPGMLLFNANYDSMIWLSYWLDLKWGGRLRWPGWGLSLCVWPIFGFRQETCALTTSPPELFSRTKSYLYTSVMWLTDSRCWNLGLGGVVFDPFWHLICWFLLWQFDISVTTWSFDSIYFAIIFL